MSSQIKPIYVFMDKVPTVSECIAAIVSYSPTYGSQLQKNAKCHFPMGVAKLWHRAFTKEHVISATSIMKKIENALKDYRSQLQKKRGNQRINRKNWQS